jgi:hypothetical protein
VFCPCRHTGANITKINDVAIYRNYFTRQLNQWKWAQSYLCLSEGCRLNIGLYLVEVLLAGPCLQGLAFLLIKPQHYYTFAIHF